MKSINGQCGTCNDIFQTSKALSTKKSNPLNNMCAKCYAISNDERLLSDVL